MLIFSYFYVILFNSSKIHNLFKKSCIICEIITYIIFNCCIIYIFLSGFLTIKKKKIHQNLEYLQNKVRLNLIRIINENT